MKRPLEVWLAAALLVWSFIPEWRDPILAVPLIGPVETFFLGATCLLYSLLVLLIVLRASERARISLAGIVALGFLDYLLQGSRGLQAALVAAAQVIAIAILLTPRVSAWMKPGRLQPA